MLTACLSSLSPVRPGEGQGWAARRGRGRDAPRRGGEDVCELLGVGDVSEEVSSFFLFGYFLLSFSFNLLLTAYLPS